MMKRFDIDKEDGARSVKERYTHPQAEGLVSVQDFLLTTAESGRCVLIRWSMDAEFPVDRFTFLFKELDAAGETLSEATVTYEGLDIPPAECGELFVPEQAIAVSDRCADIHVQLVELVSGNYVYRVKGTRAEVDYRVEDAWLYDKKAGRKEKLKKKITMRVFSKCRVKMKKRWLVTVLTVLLLTVVVFFPMIRLIVSPYVKAFAGMVKDWLSPPEEETVIIETYDETRDLWGEALTDADFPSA